MVPPPFLADLAARGLLTPVQAAAIATHERERSFSIHYELRALLYFGITLLTGGLGVLVYQNIEHIGHGMVVGFIALLLCAIMLASIAAYSFSEKARQRADIYYYEAALNVINLLALISFYLVSDYLIVREGNAALANLSVSVQIPFALLFYLFTVAVPLAYSYFGLRQANRMMLLVGLGVVWFSVYTYRFYRSLLPPEIAAVLAGLVLITGSAAALRYLRTPKHSLTAAADDDEPYFNLESLIVAQTATAPAAQTPGFEFGGGQSGGGGATGHF